MKHLVLFAIMMFIFLNSCRNKNHANSVLNFEKCQWNSSQKLVLEYDAADTTTIYDLYLRVDHTVNFRYQNLYVKVLTILPNQDSLGQVVSLEFADAKGRWEGKCARVNCKVKIALQEAFYFQNTGKYLIEVAPYMREEPIKEICLILKHKIWL